MPQNTLRPNGTRKVIIGGDPEVIKKVETFIQRMHDHDLVVKPEASKMMLNNRHLQHGSLSEFLAESINQYEKQKGIIRSKGVLAEQCLQWIDIALTHGVIQESEGLARKLTECREENTKLEKDLETLSEKYLELKHDYEALSKLIGKPLDESGLRKEG